MTDEPLRSLATYSRFVAEVLYRPTVERSTVDTHAYAASLKNSTAFPAQMRCLSASGTSA